jgi:hypothetical protein
MFLCQAIHEKLQTSPPCTGLWDSWHSSPFHHNMSLNLEWNIISIVILSKFKRLINLFISKSNLFAIVFTDQTFSIENQSYARLTENQCKGRYFTKTAEIEGVVGRQFHSPARFYIFSYDHLLIFLLIFAIHFMVS